MSVLLCKRLNLALWGNEDQELDAFSELSDDCLLSVLVGICLTWANPDMNPAVKCSVCTRKGIWRKRLLIEISIMNTSENRFAQIDRCLLYWKFVALHNLNVFFKEQFSGNIYIKHWNLSLFCVCDESLLNYVLFSCFVTPKRNLSNLCLHLYIGEYIIAVAVKI